MRFESVRRDGALSHTIVQVDTDSNVTPFGRIVHRVTMVDSVRSAQTMQDNLLRLQKAAYQVTLDTGGMFKDKLKVVIDPDESSMPYLAVAEDGWGRCVCRRYATKQEAIDNLERLHDKL